MARDYSTLGNKLGPKVAKIVQQTIISTRRAMMPLEHHMRVKATQDIIDRAGHEVADHYGPLVDKLLEIDDGSLDPAVRQFLEDARSGEHQLKAIGGLLMGSVQGAISLILNNELAKLVYPIVGANPNLELDPATAANAAARNIISYDEGANLAHRQGYNLSNYDPMYQLAQVPPDVTMLQDLVNRGRMSLHDALMWINRAGYPKEWNDAILSLRNTELSPADLALAVLRGNLGKQDGYDKAARVGTSPEQFDVLLSNTGEPPGIMQLLEAYRRHFIDEQELTNGILQSRVRDEWIPTLLKLRYVPMTVSDAVNAVVQNHLPMDEGRAIADQNGLQPGAFDTLYQTAGDPLSRTEMESLYNRGLVTEADVKQALRESRVKNKYIDDAFKLHTTLLEPRMLASAVEYGAITKEQAIKLAMDHGYSHEDAAILVNEGIQRKLFGYRNALVTAIEALYEDNAITAEDATTQIKQLGHSEDEVKLILQVAEYRRVARAKNTILSAIRSKFVQYHIDEAKAKSLMDKAQIPSGQSDFLITLWTIERTAYARVLTESQIARAVKKQLISPEDGLKRLVQMGYSEGDGLLLLAEA